MAKKSGWLFALLLWLTASQCKDRSGSRQVRTDKDGAMVVDSLPVDLSAEDTAYGNASERIRLCVLPDGSNLKLGAHSVVRISKSFGKTDRELRLDGKAVFSVQLNTEKPFVVHTRQLKIEVLGTRFLVEGFAKSPGEEVDVFEGKVKVSKSYHSTTDNEPETIGPGEMVMINRDIDLMEKETLKPEELQSLLQEW